MSGWRPCRWPTASRRISTACTSAGRGARRGNYVRQGTSVRFRLCTPREAPARCNSRAGTAQCQQCPGGGGRGAGHGQRARRRSSPGWSRSGRPAGGWRRSCSPMTSLLLEDSYNANPLSVKAALVALDELGAGGDASPFSATCSNSAKAQRICTAKSASLPRAHCDRLFVLGRAGRADRRRRPQRGHGRTARVTVAATHDAAISAAAAARAAG